MQEGKGQLHMLVEKDEAKPARATPESLGLRATGHDFTASGVSDEERLAREFPVYNAPFDYVRQQVR